MTGAVTVASTDAGVRRFRMDFKPARTHDPRQAARLLRPALVSRRLVAIFLKIAMLAVTRPAAINVIEVAVNRIGGRRPLRSALKERRRIRQAG
jgi:hypothetical protein